jgi:hypothetical protein
MTITTKPNWLLAIALPALVFLACFLITFLPQFRQNGLVISTAILGDLLITAPLLYFLAIRKSATPRITVLRVLIVGLLVAGWLLPATGNSMLGFIKTWIAPLLEAIVIFYVARAFYTAAKKAKLANDGPVDFLRHCRTMLGTVTSSPKAGNIIGSEIAVFYYAFFARGDKDIDYQSRFSMYQQNGIRLVLGSILGVLLIEAAGMHFLLALWNGVAAWIITGLSLYTCLQLFAHIRAIRARPTIIGKDELWVRNGMAGDAMVDFNNIDKLELTRHLPKGREVVKIALLKGMEAHNMVLYLKEPITVTKIFGIKKTTDTVAFFVDRPKDFAAMLQIKIDEALNTG